MWDWNNSPETMCIDFELEKKPNAQVNIRQVWFWTHNFHNSDHSMAVNTCKQNREYQVGRHTLHYFDIVESRFDKNLLCFFLNKWRFIIDLVRTKTNVRFFSLPKLEQFLPTVCVTSQKQSQPSSLAIQSIGKFWVLLHGLIKFKASQTLACAVGKPLASHSFRLRTV